MRAAELFRRAKQLERRIERLEQAVLTLADVAAGQQKYLEALPALLSESLYQGVTTRQLQVCDPQGQTVIRIRGGNAPGEAGILINDPEGRCAVLLGIDEGSGSVGIKSDGVVLAALHAEDGVGQLFAANRSGQTVTVAPIENGQVSAGETCSPKSDE